MRVIMWHFTGQEDIVLAVEHEGPVLIFFIFEN